jgi:hypothetical protein
LLEEVHADHADEDRMLARCLRHYH